MELFYEKAFWSFLALVASLVLVIYNLFKNGLGKDLLIIKASIREELKIEIDKLKDEVSKLKEELLSYKRHDSAQNNMQTELIRKLLNKLDKLDNKHPDFINKMFDENE